MCKLTDKEKEVYIFICEFIKSHSFPPSIRDIAKGCFICKTGAKKYVDILIDKGYLDYTPNIARSYIPKGGI